MLVIIGDSISLGQSLSRAAVGSLVSILCLLVLATRALCKSTASYEENVVVGRFMITIGLLGIGCSILFALISNWAYVWMAILILPIITGTAMLFPMDSSFLSFLRPFRLEKPILPRYQSSPQMAVPPIIVYYQSVPVACIYHTRTHPIWQLDR